MSHQCLIVVGEKSGEDHCLSFLSELKTMVPHVHFFGVGGDEMLQSNVELIYHLKDFSGWGVTEILHKIPFYIMAFNKILNEVKKRNVKVAILIDFQEFNFQLAKRLKKLGVKVLYYVAPQAWVWRAYRAKILSESIHTLFTIIPFEKEWFAKRGVKRVLSLKHPVFRKYQKDIPLVLPSVEPSNLLILPGSRKKEVNYLLPTFLKVALRLKKKFQINIGIVKASSLPANLFDPFEDQFNKIYNDLQLSKALKWAHCCLASSGTITLATALYALPTVVCYKVPLLTEIIYKLIVPYRGPVALANIFLDNEIIYPELLQNDVRENNIEKIMISWLTERDKYEMIRRKLLKIREKDIESNFSLPNYMANIIQDSYV